MSDKRRRNEFEQRRELQDAGWKVDQEDKVCFNSGSESNKHFVTKAQVGYLLKTNGYRVDSEVQNQDGTAEADIVAYGNGEPAFVVECETGITEKITEKKLDQFYYNEPFCECYMVEVNNMPEDRAEQLTWLAEQLGVEV